MYRIKNYPRLIIKRAKMQGYIYFDYKDKIKSAVGELLGYVQDGSLKFREDIVNGLDSAPKALQKLFLGDNNGKVLVKVLHDSDDEKYYDLPSL
jgi:NADPH-dependent curcumin reductase CurA